MLSKTTANKTAFSVDDLYFQCGLASHKKCLDVMQEECGHSPLDRRLTTFGVHISDHMQNNREGIPSVIWQCVAEIEENGMDTKVTSLSLSQNQKLLEKHVE